MNGHAAPVPVASEPTPAPSFTAPRDLGEAIIQAKAMREAGDWSAASAAHGVAVYALLSEMVDGARPDELRGEFTMAIARAGDRLRDVGGDVERLIEFITWELKREQRAQRRNDKHAKWGWRLVFGEKHFLEWATETHQELAAVVQPAQPFARISTREIFEPLGPIPYLVERLDLCPGAPAIVAGYGFTGKTIALQSMGVAVAAGELVWGRFAPGVTGRVLHLDYEQGRRLTAGRYQRLLAGAELDPDSLGDRLSVAVHPAYLGAETLDRIEHELEGHVLCIVDSLRAANPGVDENSSDARHVLDRLSKASDSTGCSIVVVHHARKPTRDAVGGAKMSIRGSGAIFDAAGSVFTFAADRGGPVRVTHEKARTSGVLCDPFELVIADVAIGDDARGGLVVTAALGSDAPNAPPETEDRLAVVRGEIVALLADGAVPSRRVLVQRVRRNRDLVLGALDELLSKGTVVEERRSHRERLLRLAEATPR